MAWWTAQEPKGVIGINVVVCAKNAGNGEDGSGIQSHPQERIISIPPNRLVDCAASGPVVVACSSVVRAESVHPRGVVGVCLQQEA